MKIAVDIRSLSNGSMTGVGYYLYNFLKNLTELDDEVKWQLLDSGHKKNQYPGLERKNVILTHYQMPNKIINASSYWSAKPNITSKLAKNADLLWLPNVNFYAKRSSAVPMVLTVHDLSFLHSNTFYSWKRRLWHRLIRVKDLIEEASLILAVSENTKRDIIRYFSVDESKIAVVNPGISYKKLTEEEARKIVKNIDLPEKYFLYVGTLEPRKNLQAVIQAFDRIHSEYPQYNLVVVGGKGWLYKPLLQAIKKRSYIKYLGYQKSPIKDALYRLAYAFVWPSFYEGFGFPPLEALAHKKPIITSYKTSLPETLLNNALYVDPYNVTDLYVSMKHLIEDQHLYLSLISDTVYLPEWREQSQNILELFRKIIEQK